MALSPGQIVARLTPIVGRVGAAGIAGNLMQESSDDPSRAGGGLAQWQGPRYAGLVRYAQSRGLPATSAEAALGYLTQDLRGPYSGLARQLRQANDPGHAAVLFSNIYERPGKPMLGNRVSYARQALGAGPQRLGALAAMPGMAPQSGGSQSVSTQVPTFDRAGFQRATNAYTAGNFLSHQQGPYDVGGMGSNPLFASGLLTTTAPNPQDFQGTRTKTVQVAQSNLQRLAGGNVLNAHPELQAQGRGLSNIAGGFLPKGAQYVVGRKDQGRDGQTNPGGAIVAPGNGVVLSVKSDPNGFGPRYPVIHWTSGRYAGRTTYVGHTLSVVRPGQRVQAGQVISRTGTKGVGNATVPGWFEIGFADSGTPGPFGQAVPF